jgi:hypothetical protein
LANESEKLVKVNPYQYELKEPVGTDWESLIPIEEQIDPMMGQFIDDKFKPTQFRSKLPTNPL